MAAGCPRPRRRHLEEGLALGGVGVSCEATHAEMVGSAPLADVERRPSFVGFQQLEQPRSRVLRMDDQQKVIASTTSTRVRRARSASPGTAA
jgi:hypothetical protein